VEQKLDSTAAELQKQKELNEKLENDLFSIDRHDHGTGTPNGKQPARQASLGGDSQQLEGGLGDEDDLLAGLDLGNKNSLRSSTDLTASSSNTGTNTRSTPIPFAPSADTSILPIVTSQRDRFRQRNAELEEELRKQYQTISELRAEIKSLQADNLKLYEKVRYMQSYREDYGGSAGSSRPSTSMHMMENYPTAGTEHEVSSKYQTRYEETINPFEAFRGRVSALIYPVIDIDAFLTSRLMFCRNKRERTRTSTHSNVQFSSLHDLSWAVDVLGRCSCSTLSLCMFWLCIRRIRVRRRRRVNCIPSRILTISRGVNRRLVRIRSFVFCVETLFVGRCHRMLVFF
jgi:uncharacterized coiled-coil protein SlyX